MPLLTIASAICRISVSLMLQPNVFQLFQPIGGVRATPFSSAWALGASRVVTVPVTSGNAAASAIARRMSRFTRTSRLVVAPVVVPDEHLGGGGAVDSEDDGLPRSRRRARCRQDTGHAGRGQQVELVWVSRPSRQGRLL